MNSSDNRSAIKDAKTPASAPPSNIAVELRNCRKLIGRLHFHASATTDMKPQAAESKIETMRNSIASIEMTPRV